MKRKKKDNTKAESRLEAEEWLYCHGVGEYLSQVLLCPAWAWQISGIWMGMRYVQPWQLFMGGLVALKDKPYAWLWLGSRLGWPEGLDFLKLLLLQVLWFPCWAGPGRQPELPSQGQQTGRDGASLPSGAHRPRDILTVGKTGQQRQPTPGGGGKAGFPGLPGTDLSTG